MQTLSKTVHYSNDIRIVTHYYEHDYTRKQSEKHYNQYGELIYDKTWDIKGNPLNMTIYNPYSAEPVYYYKRVENKEYRKILDRCMGANSNMLRRRID